MASRLQQDHDGPEPVDVGDPYRPIAVGFLLLALPLLLAAVLLAENAAGRWANGAAAALLATVGLILLRGRRR